MSRLMEWIEREETYLRDLVLVSDARLKKNNEELGIILSDQFEAKEDLERLLKLKELFLKQEESNNDTA